MESWPLGVAVVVFAVLAHHISPPHSLGRVFKKWPIPPGIYYY